MQAAIKRELKRATPEEQRNRSIIREQIGHQLKNHYQACTTEELPPRLLAALKRLDESFPQAHSQSKSVSK
jgi:hypothetical protein